MSTHEQEKILKVETDEQKPFAGQAVPGDKRELSPAELNAYRNAAQKLIDTYRRFFITFARDVSLRFRVSDKFFIDLERGEVHSDAQWFADRDFTPDQILWAHLHELSHFRDLAEDPERMMQNFDYIYDRAKETGAMIMKKWEDKFGSTDPDFIDMLKQQAPIRAKNHEKTMNPVEQAAYQIHHLFYNIFDDICVNNLVSRRAPKYEKGRPGGDGVERVYAEKLFPKTDYREFPRHLQFVWALLREEMCEEDVRVSDEVGEVLQGKIRFEGKWYAPREIVERFVKPKSGRDTRAGRRYEVLQKTLEPIFRQLLLKDIEEWDPEKPEVIEVAGGISSDDANPFGADYREYRENNPDQFGDDDMRNWLDQHQEEAAQRAAEEGREREEAAKTPGERAREAQEAMDRAWCAENNVDYATLQRFRRIESEVAPYLEDLSRLWRRIVFGSTREIERGIEGYYETGTELDVAKAIEEWPKIQEGEFTDIRVMKKMVAREDLVKRPELIRVRLVGDLSGSMDDEKRHVLEQCFVLILSSLREFNRYLNVSRARTKSKLDVDTEAWAFGGIAKKIKRFHQEGGLRDEWVEIAQIFQKLREDLGSTRDNLPLAQILESLAEDDRKKISQGKILDIVFEVTDGGSSNPGMTREVVDQLIASGVAARALQIGAVSEDEKEAFNRVWNDDREEGLGEAVGPRIEKLLPAVTALLKRYLGNVRL